MVDEKMVPEWARHLSFGGNPLYGDIKRSEAGADKMDGETEVKEVEKMI